MANNETDINEFTNCDCGARGIGKCIGDEFKKQGAKFCIIDILDNPYFIGDLSDKETQKEEYMLLHMHSP
ncbi:MAG: hypothetical protein ACI4U3_11125 [Traorella sp.]